MLDLETNTVKTSRSLAVDEREIGGTYDNSMTSVINTVVIKTKDEGVMDCLSTEPRGYVNGDEAMEDASGDGDVETQPVDNSSVTMSGDRDRSP